MTRYVHNNGLDVYDDDTDQWLRFDTPQDGQAYASQVDARADVQVMQARPSGLATFTVPLSTTGVVLLPMDPSRVRAVLGLTGPSGSSAVARVGTRETVTAGGGFVLVPGAQLKVEVTAEIWCVGQNLTGGELLSAWTEYGL